MHCNGKCQMLKKMNSTDSKEDKSTGQKGSRQEEVQAIFAVAQPELVDYYSSIPYFDKYESGNLQSRLFAVFHPPKA